MKKWSLFVSFECDSLSEKLGQEREWSGSEEIILSSTGDPSLLGARSELSA